MPKVSTSSQRPIFLISPPGSLEAGEIGYINIPKIVEDPPSEINEIHGLTDNSGLFYSTQKSNFWVYGPFIKSKKTSYDLIIPLFPNFLKYSIPWIVCEYALKCVETDDLLSLREFVGNTIKRRISDFDISTILLKKTWREKKTPINWIKVVARCKKKREIDRSGLFHIPRYLSIDEPAITSDLFDEGQSITVLESLYQKGGRQKKKVAPRSDFFNSLWETPEDELFGPIFEDDFWNAIDGGCKNAGLSITASNLLKTHLESTPSILGAARELGLSTREYETARKELQRKINTLRKYLGKV